MRIIIRKLPNRPIIKIVWAWSPTTHKTHINPMESVGGPHFTNHSYYENLASFNVYLFVGNNKTQSGYGDPKPHRVSVGEASRCGLAGRVPKVSPTHA